MTKYSKIKKIYCNQFQEIESKYREELVKALSNVDIKDFNRYLSSNSVFSKIKNIDLINRTYEEKALYWFTFDLDKTPFHTITIIFNALEAYESENTTHR